MNSIERQRRRQMCRDYYYENREDILKRKKEDYLLNRDEILERNKLRLLTKKTKHQTFIQ